MSKKNYLEPTQEAGRRLFMRQLNGNIVMLNMLRFRKTADYSQFPELDPGKPVSGEEAYRLYMEHTLPFLRKSGGEILFMGDGGDFLIGPEDEYWDAVLLIRQQSLASFMAFAQDIEYLKGMGHRTAALEDSRLLPLSETKYL